MRKIESKEMNIKVILDGKLTNIIGPNSSGKTYFLKKIINLVNNKDIYLDDLPIKEYSLSYLKSNLFVVLNDDLFKEKNVLDELSYYLNTLGFNKKDVLKRRNDLIKFFKIENIENSKIDELSVNLRTFIKILSMLIVNPSLLGIDDLLSYLNDEQIDLIIKYAKKHNITLINVTTNAEYLSLSNRVLVLNDMKCIYSGNIKELLGGNSILPYIGIKLPFVLELSNNLMLYGMVKNPCFNSKELVNKIWK